MKRLCLSIVCLAGAVAWTEASAQSQSTNVPKSTKHAAKFKMIDPIASKTASLGEIQFSDPYAPPVGVHKTAVTPFPTRQTEEPHDPQGGGMSFTAGKDAPDAPFTGGLKFRF
jgi:hypothetical protein